MHASYATNPTITPVIFDLTSYDKHERRDFTNTILDFAAGAGAFVYRVPQHAIGPDAKLFVASPRPLDGHELLEAFHEHEIETVTDLMAEGYTSEHVLAGETFRHADGRIEHRRYFVSKADLDRIAAELEKHTPPLAPSLSNSTTIAKAESAAPSEPEPTTGDRDLLAAELEPIPPAEGQHGEFPSTNREPKATSICAAIENKTAKNKRRSKWDCR